MHILFIRTQNPFFESSADANRFSGLLKGLMANGVKVTMLVTMGYNNLAELKARGVPLGYYNLTVHYSNCMFNNNIWLRRFNTLVIGSLLNKINKNFLNKYFKNKYDYVWITKNACIMSNFVNSYDCIKSKTLIELNEFHDIYKEEGAIRNSVQQKRAKKTERCFAEAIMRIDRFAIMTNTLVEHYKKITKPEAKFIHLPMTVDLSRFKNVPTTNKYKKPYIAFTGTFNNAKDGVDILIKSFAKIANKYPNLHLYLAGFWHYDVPKQKELIIKLGLEDRITYLGIINKDLIPEFVCNASLLALSRPNSHQAQGGFPTKLGEYLATGNPVCVTRVGEIPNYLEDNVSAFMAKPSDVDSFADAMDRALKDPNSSKTVSTNGKKVSKTHFNLDIQSKRLYDFLIEN